MQQMVEMSVDKHGNIVDTHLEDIFNDIFFANVCDITKHNFRVYVGALMDLESADIPDEIWTDAAKAVEFVSNLGSISLWRLTSFDIESDPDIKKYGFTHGAKYGFYEEGVCVYGRNIQDAVLLALMQALREVTMSQLNAGEEVKH